MFLIVVLSLIAVGSAAVPQKCCISHQLSGVMLTIGATHKHGASMLNVLDQNMVFQYDWDRKLSHVIVDAVNTTTGVRYQTNVLLDYMFNTTFITLPNGQCLRQHLDPNSMQSPCFTAGFTYQGTKRVGVGSEGARVNAYTGQFDNDAVTITVTDDSDCFPVSYMGYGEHGMVRRMNAYLYTNIQKTINNEILHMPRNCVNAPYIDSTKRALEEHTGIRIRVPF